MKITKPKLKIGDRVRISKSDIQFRKGYKPKFTDEILIISAITTKKAHIYVIKGLKNKENMGKFHEKKLKFFQIKG